MRGRYLTILAVLAVTAAVVIMPAERSGWDWQGVASFLTAFLTTVAIYGLFTLGLNVQWGYTGVFNFGVAAFFMVGAYTAAIFTKGPAAGSFDTYIGGFGEKLSLPFLAGDQWFPFLVGAVVAALMCGALAYFLSIPTLRLREDYLAIATIGIAELMRNAVIAERGLVNSERGLKGIPRPFYDFFSPDQYQYVYLGLALVVLLLTFLAVERVARSPWGRVLRALREDETATAASGKDVFAFKRQGFVVGAMIMGIGGALYAYERGAVSPGTFTHFAGTFVFWVMLLVGGSGNNKGAILGAYIVWGLWIVSLQLLGYPLPDFIQVRIFYMRDFLLGALLVTVLLLRPQGLLPEERRVSIWVERRLRREAARRAPVAEKAPSSHEG